MLALPAEDRAFLARELIASLDRHCDPDAETQWNDVIERRSREIEQGQVVCGPVDKRCGRSGPSSMRVVSHPEAKQELEAAALWYDQRQSGLARSSSKSSKPTLDRILAEPERWHLVQGDNRKLNFHRFPYAIVYSLRTETLFVKAVMHLHRRPSYWQERR